MSQRSPKQESGDEAGDLREMVSQNNLGCLSEFYRSAESWFRPQPDHPRDTPDAGSRPSDCDTNREQCLHYLQISVFLMLCAHLEETLCLYCKRKECDTKKETGLGRFSRCVQHLLGGTLDKCTAWEFLNDAFKIRNTLLHANGRPTLMREKTRQDIRRIVEKHNDSFRWPEVLLPVQSSSGTAKLEKSNDTRIEILPAGLHKLSMSIQQLIRELSPSK
jgi:hypothetical protein